MIDQANILKAMNEYDSTRFDRLRDYYDGKHDILYRTFVDTTKPNNKVMTNLCKILTNSNVNHFVGKPIAYSSTDDSNSDVKALQEILDFNNERSVNSALAKYASIYSVAYELLYTKANDKGIVLPAIKALDLRKQSVFVKKDNTVDENVEWAIRWYTDVDDESKKYLYLYTKDEVVKYEVDGGSMVEVERTTHVFGEVPIIEYHNKEVDGFGDFEDVMTLNDAYNLLNSDDINESDYSNDAYLIIKGMTVDAEELQQLKENRAIVTDSDGSVEWLLKAMDPVWKNSIKDRLRQDLFAVSGTPDMTDENFAGQASGVALKYKLLDFENNRADKERSFTLSLQKRIRLIFNFLAIKGKQFDWREISLQFTANLPQSLKDEMEVVKGFTGLGIVSKQTLRSLLSFVDDPAHEERLLEEEDSGGMKLDQQEPFGEEVDEDDDEDDGTEDDE